MSLEAQKARRATIVPIDARWRWVCQRHSPAALPPEQSPGTHCAGSWVDLRAGVDVYGKSLLPELEP